MGHKDYFIYNGFLQGEKMIILQTGVPGSGKTSKYYFYFNVRSKLYTFYR